MNMKVEGNIAQEQLLAGLEVSEAELKRYRNQVGRFGNEELKNHPQLGNVQNTLKVLQPEQLRAVLKNTNNAMRGQGETTRIAHVDIPQLAEPDMRPGQINSSAQMTELLGKVMLLATETSIQNLVAELKAFNAKMSSSSKMYAESAEYLEVLGTQLAKDKDLLSDAKAQSGSLQQKVNEAQSALEVANKKLSALDAQAVIPKPPLPAAEPRRNVEGKSKDTLTTPAPAMKHNPPLSVEPRRNVEGKHKDAVIPQTSAETQQLLFSPEFQQSISAAHKDIIAAQAQVATTTANYESFTENTLNPAVQAENRSDTALKEAMGKAQALLATLSPTQQDTVEKQLKQRDKESKSLVFLLAVMSELIDKNASEELKASADLKQKLAEAAAKDAEKKAKEYEEQARKADEMQKTMGCVGKALGWLIVAVSTIAAVFTGGASLAFAAVGLALALGDEINQAVNGRSFMADAMQPVMDSIVKPLMDIFAKAFGDLLKGLGVDKSTAEMIGQIMGAVAAAVTMIVGVIVAGKVASKAVGALMTEFTKTITKNAAQQVAKEVAKNVARTVAKDVATEITQEVAKKTVLTTMQKLMNSAIGQMLKRLTQGLGRSMGMSEVKMAQVSTGTQIGVGVGSMANSTIQMAGNIVAADMRIEAAKAKAQLINDLAFQEILNEMMSIAIDTFQKRIETISSIIKNMSAVSENQMQAGKYVAKQIGMVAG